MNLTKFRARAIIKRDGQYLLIHRWKNGHEYFSFPGGGKEEDETPQETVVREVFEETGFIVHVVKYIDTIKHDRQEHHYYLCEIDDGVLGQGNGPEYDRQNPNNVYIPEFVDISTVTVPIYHEEIVQLIRRKDL
ncbi:MAG TPA: NUDIX domain-containing protein [Acidobacteriota bacterium]|nr:NUDIX domain-containing protein [Acidobacteriota bacterium]